MSINPWYRYELNTTTYTEIGDIEVSGSGNVKVLYYTEDGTSFYIANDSDGTNAYTVPDDTAITEKANVSNGILCYAKATYGTPTLVVKLGSLK